MNFCFVQRVESPPPGKMLPGGIPTFHRRDACPVNPTYPKLYGYVISAGYCQNYKHNASSHLVTITPLVEDPHGKTHLH